MAAACVFGIIISKLGYWYELNPIVLLEIDIDSEIQFYCAVFSLNLTVSLKIKYGKKFLFDAKKVAEQ